MATDGSTSTAAPRRRRSARTLLHLLAAALVLAALCLWVTTRSWFLIARLQPVLEQRLGGVVAMDRVTYQGAGRLAIAGLTVSSRVHRGSPAEVVRIGEAMVVVNVADLVRGRVTVKGLTLRDVRLRLSEDARETGSFTFMALTPHWLAEDSANELFIELPPYVIIEGALIEVGVHEDDRFQVTGRRWVKGAMAPQLDRPGWMGFTVMETNPETRDDAEGIVMQGAWNVTTNEYRSRVESVTLDEGAYGLCPSIARLWWDQMHLAGRVSEATISWDPKSSLGISFEVENVGMTLPIGAQQFWARYQDGVAFPCDAWPRMHVTSGTVRLSRDSIFLENLVGELRSGGTDEHLVGVPYAISLALPRLPTLDWENREGWLESVLESAPFEMSVRLNEISLKNEEHDAPPAVDIPIVVARFLERFQISDWALSAEFDLTRGESGVIDSVGEAYIHQARGAFEAFPYQLEGIDAYLQFDAERVTIHQLDARGSDGAPIHIVGEISPVGANAGIHLQLRAENVPLDDRLRAALKPPQQRLYDALLHDESERSLRAAGLLADEASVADAWRNLEAVRSELATAGDEERDRLEGRRRRLENLVAAGPFSLDGRINLDLTVDRAQGPGERPVTQGRIDILRAGMVFDRFPYPVTIIGGAIDWRPERIEILSSGGIPGAPVIASGGGRGVVSGSIELVRSDGLVRPRMDLRIVTDDDEITPTLLAAIPPTKRDRQDERFETAWPGDLLSRGARTIEALGLSGPLSYTGTLRSGEERRVEFDFDIQIEDGAAHPTSELSDVLGRPGLDWPESWWFEDVRGALRIDNDRLELLDLAGRHAAGDVSADGVIDLRADGRGTDLAIRFRDVEIGEHLIDVMPDEQTARAREIWERYRPEGRLDALLAYRSRPEDGAAPLTVDVMPGSIGIELDGKPMSILRRDGHVRIGPGAIEIAGLDVDIESGDDPWGRLRLHGFHRDAEPGASDWRVEGRWDHGDFSCPLISHLMRRLSGPDQLKRFRTLRPEGLFDGDFVYGSREAETAPDDRFTFRPQRLSLQVDDLPISIEFDDGSQFTFSNQRIALDAIAGRNGAARFELEGVIDLVDGIDARLDVGFEGPVRSRQFRAITSDTFNNALDAISFDDGRGTRIVDSRLRFRIPLGQPEDATGPIIEFDGTVETDGAAFNPGMKFSEVTGAFEIMARHGPGTEARLELRTTGARATVMKNEVTGAAASLRLDAARDVIVVEDVRGTLHDGIVSAQALAGVGENRDFEVSVDLAGVSLAALLASQQEDGVEGPSRGTCYAGLDLSGVRGDPAARLGRGMVRIIGGMASVPLVMRLTQVSQLTLPFGNRLDYGEVDFYINGSLMTFEQILLESGVGDLAMLQLLGTGTMELDGFDLDTRFRSRGGVAIVRDVVGGIGDQLYQIKITGPLGDPDASLVPLPGLGAVAGPAAPAGP